jgi:cytidyltransferase-like protein
MNIGREIVQELIESTTPIIALYPGKFKPPHAGHFDVVAKAANIADKVIVIMSNVPKDEFTPEDSMKVWRLYEDLLPSNVQILISGKSSPVSEVFDIIKDKATDFIVLYGKGEESRYRTIEKDPNTYSNVKIVDAGTFESLNATDLRTAIRNKDLEDIQKFLPKGIDAKKVLDVYTQKEFKPGPVLHESFTPQKAPLMKKFVEYACNELNIDEPKIHVINSPTYSQENHSFGGYIPSEEKILVVVHNRNMADILRTLAHELVHHHQKLNGDELDGEDGSDTENEANARAGVIMRKFGRENPEIFENKLNESDPKTGTGKKPKGSGRRLYTDEDPKDTVPIKFKTKEDIVDTLNKSSFKSKPHNRQSQIINVIHQRVRAAYSKAKDSEVKSRLKRALDYIEKRKETSKKKTERLNKLK